MNLYLQNTHNWSELAQEAKWSVAALAKICRVSVRTLHRSFLKQMGKNPKCWLAENRQRCSVELLRDGASIKETASRLGYNQSGNFARAYKAHFGVSPTFRLPTISRVETTNGRK